MIFKKNRYEIYDCKGKYDFPEIEEYYCLIQRAKSKAEKLNILQAIYDLGKEDERDEHYS